MQYYYKAFYAAKRLSGATIARARRVYRRCLTRRRHSGAEIEETLEAYLEEAPSMIFAADFVARARPSYMRHLRREYDQEKTYYVWRIQSWLDQRGVNYKLYRQDQSFYIPAQVSS